MEEWSGSFGAIRSLFLVLKLMLTVMDSQKLNAATFCSRMLNFPYHMPTFRSRYLRHHTVQNKHRDSAIPDIGEAVGM